MVVWSRHLGLSSATGGSTRPPVQSWGVGQWSAGTVEAPLGLLFWLWGFQGPHVPLRGVLGPCFRSWWTRKGSQRFSLYSAQWLKPSERHWKTVLRTRVELEFTKGRGRQAFCLLPQGPIFVRRGRQRPPSCVVSDCWCCAFGLERRSQLWPSRRAVCICTPAHRPLVSFFFLCFSD